MKNTEKKRMSPRPRKEVDSSTYSGRFAIRLRLLREKTGMSLGELSAKLGIPKNTLQRWETGINSPPVNAYPKLAEHLHVKIRTLIPEK